MSGAGIGLLQVACRGQGGAAPFSPLSLFASGEEGAFFDPSDLSTLFQDAAGTTPVTADSQPVRLMLDKSKGLALGAELATGANAAEDDTNATTGWDSVSADVFESQSSVTNGSSFALHINSNTTASAAARMYRSLAGLTIGRAYRVTVDARHVGTGGLWGIFVGSSATGSELLLLNLLNTDTTFQSITATFIASASTNFIVVREASASNDGGVYLDNLSIKELPGNHATAPSDAARPLYKTAGGLSQLDFDGVDDVLNSTNPSLGTSASLARAVPAGAIIQTGLTIGANRADNTDHYGLILLNRAFTAGEQAALTTYLDGKSGA